MRKLPSMLGALLSVSAMSCVSVTTDPDETGAIETGALVEFDPGASVVPFPNNLLRSPTTGLVNLPQQCGESAAQTQLRTAVLNQLDGFGTFKPVLRFTTTEAVDPASIEGNVVLLRRADKQAAIDPATAKPVPFVAVPTTTTRAAADCMSSKEVPAVVLVPKVPLEPSSTYVVVVKRGLKTAVGAEFAASSTWGLVRQATNPVTVQDGKVVAERTPLSPFDAEDLQKLLGINTLWMAHAQGVAFAQQALNIAREDMVLAWEFSTQTTTAPLDPKVTGSIAAGLPMAPLGTLSSITNGNAEAFMQSVLGTNACAAVGCAAIGDVQLAPLTAPRFQTLSVNPLAGKPQIPGPFADPRMPTSSENERITVLTFIPATAAPPAGYPTVIFGHGLGQDRSNLFAIASQLAGRGFASVAIDFVAHGSRAVQVTDAAAAGCAGSPNPKAAPQCFAPFLSANLAATRDNFRQTVLDLQTLSRALTACGTTACGSLKVNPAKIGYTGISLGGIMGTMVTAMVPEVKGAVLSVPGAGLVDVIENTESLPIRCSLVNSLIDAGVVVGEKWNPVANTGICLTNDWKAQASYKSFASIARWILDPADTANFASKLAGRKVLLQKVTGDKVIPNVTTDALGALAGLAPKPAVKASAFPPPPTDATPGSKWFVYTDLPGEAGGFPGNSYAHGSLLAPATATADGALGTAQMQTDAITFLSLQLLQ